MNHCKSNCIVAVIGASKNKEKWGWKVFNFLSKHYKTFPVNPNYEKINNHKCYASLSLLPKKPDWVVIIVKPSITELIVKECVKLGIKNIWMQPGSESKRAIKYCLSHHINLVYNTCILIKGGEFK